MRLRGLTPAALVAALLAACGSSPAPVSPTPDLTVIARVGSVSITQAEFDTRLSAVEQGIAQGGGGTPSSGAMLASIRARVMQGLITDAVIAQQASALGIAASDADVNAEIAKDEQAAGGHDALMTQLAQAGTTLDQLRDETRSRLNEEHLENHLAKARADEALRALAGGTAFATVARQYSDDAQSAAAGGDAGVMSQAALAAADPAFRAAVAGLRAGQTVAAPVRDAQGYDIIRVTAVTAAGPHVWRILVAAPIPYTVQDRTEWFGAGVLLALSNLCSANQVRVFIDAGSQPCIEVSPSPSP